MRGDLGWVLRQVRDELVFTVRAAVSGYGGGAGGNPEACAASTWLAMRFLVEESVRRFLMGVKQAGEVAKLPAWGRLLQTLRNLEERLLTPEEMERLHW